MRRRLLAVPLVLAAGLAAGTALGSIGTPTEPFRVHTASEYFQGDPDIAAQGDGYVVVWYEVPQDAKAVVYAQRFGPDDAPRGGVITVSQVSGDLTGPAVDAAPDGSFVVTWTTSTNHVRARRVSAAGVPQGDEINVTTGTEPDVAVAADGSFVIVAAGPGQTVAQRYDSQGAAQGELVSIGPNDFDGEPAADIDGTGRLFVSWSNYALTDSSDYVRVRGYDAQLTPLWDAKPVVDDGSDTAGADLVATGDGFAVVWEGAAASSDPVQPFARRFGADGSAVGGPVQVDPTGSGGRRLPRIARGSDGGLLVAWERAGGSGLSQRAIDGRAFNADLSPAGDARQLTDDGSTHAIAALSGQLALAYQLLGQDIFVDVYARRAPYDLTGGAGTTATTTDTTTTTTPPPAPVATPAPTPAPTVVTKPLALSAVAKLPSNRKCVSRRHFRIRLRHPAGGRIASAVVKVNGKRVATRRGSRVTAPVDLRGLPKGRFTVAITVKLTDGRTVKGTRRYRTCSAKRRSSGRKSPV